MEITVTIPDEIAQSLWRRSQGPFVENNQIGIDEAVRSSIEEVILRYHTFPAIISDREKAAMAFVRAKAMEHAAAIKPDHYSIERAAEDITDYILGR